MALHRNPAFQETPPISVCCSHCGSKDVRRDADAAWSEEYQQWELTTVYDNATCEHCGGETSLIETPLTQKDPTP